MCLSWISFSPLFHDNSPKSQTRIYLCCVRTIFQYLKVNGLGHMFFIAFSLFVPPLFLIYLCMCNAFFTLYSTYRKVIWSPHLWVTQIAKSLCLHFIDEKIEVLFWVLCGPYSHSKRKKFRMQQLYWKWLFLEL